MSKKTSEELDTISDKAAFMETMKSLRPDLFYPVEWSDEQRAEVSEMVKPSRVRTAMFASIPLRCLGDHGEKCHPAGVLITTTSGKIPIEKLDPNKDRLVSWDSRNSYLRGLKNGVNFELNSRLYSGYLINIMEGDNNVLCTHDHKVPIRWAKEAREGKFCVYLMRKGDFWRVGKCKLFYGKNNMIFGPMARTRAEGADCFWILNVYDTNTEATLGEEYFSCFYGISKSCFKAFNNSRKIKWDGLYKWISQDQLDQHHKSLAKDEDFYCQMLASMGLCIDHPFAFRTRERSGLKILELEACNILSGLMTMPTEKTEPIYRNRFERGSDKSIAAYKTIWAKVYTNSIPVTNIKVYSLEVQPNPYYIANGIVVHNCKFKDVCPLFQKGMAPGKNLICPVELSIAQEFMTKYIDELGVDPDNLVEVSIVRDMVDQEIQTFRKAWLLSMEDFIQENPVGVDANGKVIYRKELHLAVELEDKLHRRKRDLRNQLLATREARAKVGQGALDTAQTISNILENVREIEGVRASKLKQKLGYDEEFADFIDAEVVDEPDGRSS